MRRVIFKLHVYAALITLPFLLMYAISGFLYAHSFLDLSRFTRSNIVPNPSISLETEADGLNYLVEQFDLSINKYHVYSDTYDKKLISLSLEGINSSYTLERDVNNQWNIISRAPNFAAYLQSIHRLAGIDKENLTFKYWGIVVLIVALCLIVVSVSGIVLWLRRMQDRRFGVLVLLASTSYGAVVLAVLRWGG